MSKKDNLTDIERQLEEGIKAIEQLKNKNDELAQKIKEMESESSALQRQKVTMEQDMRALEKKNEIAMEKLRETQKQEAKRLRKKEKKKAKKKEKQKKLSVAGRVYSDSPNAFRKPLVVSAPPKRTLKDVLDDDGMGKTEKLTSNQVRPPRVHPDLAQPFEDKVFKVDEGDQPQSASAKIVSIDTSASAPPKPKVGIRQLFSATRVHTNEALDDEYDDDYDSDEEYEDDYYSDEEYEDDEYDDGYDSDDED